MHGQECKTSAALFSCRATNVGKYHKDCAITIVAFFHDNISRECLNGSKRLKEYFMMASCNFAPFRTNLQLMLAFFVLVALSVVIIHQRTNSNDYYETLQQLEKLPKIDYDERIVTGFPINNRKYNLIDEIYGFGKWKKIFKSYNSKECNLGE